MLMELDVGDRATIITTLNDDSVFRVAGCAAFGSHGSSYRICGIKRQIENLRSDHCTRISLRYNKWQIPEGAEEQSVYEPAWNDPDEKLIEEDVARYRFLFTDRTRFL